MRLTDKDQGTLWKWLLGAKVEAVEYEPEDNSTRVMGLRLKKGKKVFRVSVYMELRGNLLKTWMSLT